jgi:CarD family transcriptional regulator
MKFSVGDRVIHRTRGAGVIAEKKEMQFTETPQRYLVIEMLGSDSTLMVPTDQAEERLRPACKEAKLRRLLTSKLAAEPEELPQDYRERTKHLANKLKSGETKEWVEVVRDLTYRDEQTQLSSADRELLDRAVDLLSGELALVHGIPQEEAVPRLKSMIEHRQALVEGLDQGGGWWQSLGQKVIAPFAKISNG